MNKCGTNLDVPFVLRMILGTTNSIVGLIAFVGNLFMFVIVYKNHRLQTRSNACLLSLAMTDFLVGLVIEPMHVMQFFMLKFRNNCIFNTIRRFLSTLLLCASVMSIALISYDRYIHLTKTINYSDHMPKKKIALLIAFCWVLPAAMPFLRFAGESLYSAAIIMLLVAVFTTMIICYYFVMKVVKSTSIARPRGRETRNHIKVAKAIAIIIICFVILFTPIAVFMGLVSVSALPTVNFTGFAGEVKEICYAIGMTAAMINSALNPAIYYFRIPELRENLKKLLSLSHSQSWSTKKGSATGENSAKSTEESSFQDKSIEKALDENNDKNDFAFSSV